MDKTKLEMDFRDIGGKKFTISIDEPRENLSEIEVREAMEDIVDGNIFFSTTGDIVDIAGARLISTSIQEFEL